MNRALPRATVRSAVYLAFALCMITTAVNLQAPLYDALAARDGRRGACRLRTKC